MYIFPLQICISSAKVRFLPSPEVQTATRKKASIHKATKANHLAPFIHKLYQYVCYSVIINKNVKIEILPSHSKKKRRSYLPRVTRMRKHINKRIATHIYLKNKITIRHKHKSVWPINHNKCLITHQSKFIRLHTKTTHSSYNISFWQHISLTHQRK